VQNKWAFHSHLLLQNRSQWGWNTTLSKKTVQARSLQWLPEKLHKEANELSGTGFNNENKKIIIIAIYGSSSGQLDELFAHLCSILNQISNIGRCIVLLGNFNIQELFEKFVDSPYYSKSNLCAGVVMVSFLKYLPWQAMHWILCPDLAPCDFWAFPTMKSELWGNKFWSDQWPAAQFREVGRAL